MKPRNETESFQTNSGTKKNHFIYAFFGTGRSQKLEVTPINRIEGSGLNNQLVSVDFNHVTSPNLTILRWNVICAIFFQALWTDLWGFMHQIQSTYIVIVSAWTLIPTNKLQASSFFLSPQEMKNLTSHTTQTKPLW